MNDEKKKILKMLDEGKVTVEEAEELLDKVESSRESEESGLEPVEVRGKPRALRIIVVEEGEEEVNISIPLKLVRMFETLLPSKAKKKLDEKGVNLDVVLDAIEDETVDGKLVDIHDGDTHVEVKLTR
ncbi:MAG: SHOCT-like domain-containing protein [Candidatus Bipolaricaulota bacterium]